MRVLKKENVILESKSIVEDFSTSWFNYGSNQVIDAERDERFKQKIKQYILVFNINGKKKAFSVDKEIFIKANEGSIGTLIYKKYKFINFE